MSDSKKKNTKSATKTTKPYRKPKISSEKVPSGGLHVVVCDGLGHTNTKVDVPSGCLADRLLS